MGLARPAGVPDQAAFHPALLPAFEPDRAAMSPLLRYPSDLIDAEWSLVEPLIPPAKRGGNKRRVNLREIVNGIMYMLSTGCQWRAIPKDLPPRSTVFAYLDLWIYDGTLDRMQTAPWIACTTRFSRLLIIPVFGGRINPTM
jgi:transposase